MGHLEHLEHFNVHILISTNVPLRPTTVEMPNLTLIETKRITVLFYAPS
jgi:hypothetical protein